MLSQHQANMLVQALYFLPERKCCPINYRHATQAADLPSAMPTADRAETASRSLSPKNAGSGGRKKAAPKTH